MSSKQERVESKIRVGLTFAFAQSIASKSLGFIVQISLGWLLLKQDFGLYGLARTATVIGAVFSAGPILQILVQKQHHFKSFVRSAQWLAIVLGFCGAILMVLIAPSIASRLADEQNIAKLRWMIVILAFEPLATSFGVPSLAKMRIEMRFPEIAAIAFQRNIIEATLKVGLAFFGFGAFSFCVAFLCGAIFQSIRQRIAAPLDAGVSRGSILKWRPFINDHLFLLLTAVAFTALELGDYFVLGLALDDRSVGIYVFAFQISVQSLVLVGASFMTILFSAFSKFGDDREGQLDCFQKQTRSIALIGMPLCFAQAALISPVLRLLFGDTWNSAIPIIEVLSIGMAFRVVSWCAAGLMEAQARFRERMLLAWITLFGLLVLAILGARLSGVLGVAVGVSILYASAATANVIVAIRKQIRVTHFIRQMYGIPVLCGGGSALIAWVLGNHIESTVPPGSLGLCCSILFRGIVFLLCYGIALWQFDRNQFSRLFNVARGRVSFSAS